MNHLHRALLGLGAGATLLFTLGCGNGGATSRPGGGSITFTASGEVLALEGYSFPPAPGGVAFVDGWEVQFSEVIVTLDKITISDNPDLDTGDQARTGAIVAEVDGPWAVDLHKGGPLPGKGGSDEQAIEIANIDKQNKNGDKPFQADTHYAFGFQVVPATAGAKLLNLDDQGTADYELMKQEGYTVLYVGTATFQGGAACSPQAPVFDQIPKQVSFKLGFRSPTSYENCQNPDNDPARPLGDEEHERGVIVKANQAITAQMTIHTDHPFWESFAHDSPAHFDPIAARAPVDGPVTLAALAGVDPNGFKDRTGHDLPWRSCTPDYTPPDTGTMHFDTGGIPVNPSGNPSRVIRDYVDFMTYAQSTQGHLNSDGLCSVKRNYPSPP